MLAIYLSVPEADNHRRSIKIFDGIRAARKLGRWVSGTPLGYKYARDEFNKPFLVPNPKTADAVRWAFEQASAGQPQRALLKDVHKRFTVKWSKSAFCMALRNPLYIGKVIVPAFESEPRYEVKGVHEPLISEELFYKVQGIIDSKKKPRWRGPKNKVVCQELTLRGHLLCSKCNRTMTGSASKSRNGQRHFYYHCNFCSKERIKAAVLNDNFTSILGEIKFKKSVTDLYEAFIKKYLNGTILDRKNKLMKLQQDLEKTNLRLKNLKDKYADNELSPVDYQEMSTPYRVEAEKLCREIAEINSVKGEYDEYLKFGIDFCYNLPEAFQKADLETRHKIIGSIFPEKIFFDGISCRTTRINEALYRMLLLDEGSKGNKKGQALLNMSLASRVGPLGIEPSTHRL